jgi:hypothetical protein
LLIFYIEICIIPWHIPLTYSPTPSAAFCCDQDVVFSPSINRFIWWRQGLVESDGSNINTLVLSGVNSTTPEFLWTLSASDFDGTISGTWLDYPRIDVSNSFLYMTWNLYSAFFNSCFMSSRLHHSFLLPSTTRFCWKLRWKWHRSYPLGRSQHRWIPS